MRLVSVLTNNVCLGMFSAADAKTSGELTEDEIFAQRLADIKKDGKKKAAQVQKSEA